MGCCKKSGAKNIISIYNIAGIKLNSINFDQSDNEIQSCGNKIKIDFGEDDFGPKYRYFDNPPQLSEEGYWKGPCSQANKTLMKDGIKYLVGAANNYDHTIKCSPSNCLDDIGFDYFLEVYINDVLASGFPKQVDNKTNFYATDKPFGDCQCGTSARQFYIDWSKYNLKTGDEIKVFVSPSGNYQYPAFIAINEPIPSWTSFYSNFVTSGPYPTPFQECSTSLQFIQGELSKTLVDNWIWSNPDLSKYDKSFDNLNLVGNIDCFLDSNINISLPNRISNSHKKYKVTMSFQYKSTDAALQRFSGFFGQPFFPVDPPIPPPNDPVSDYERTAIMNAVNSFIKAKILQPMECIIEMNSNHVYYDASDGRYDSEIILYNDPLLETDQIFTRYLFARVHNYLIMESSSDVKPDAELTNGQCFKGILSDKGYRKFIEGAASFRPSSNLFQGIFNINATYLNKLISNCQHTPPSSAFFNLISFNVGLLNVNSTPILQFTPYNCEVRVFFDVSISLEEIN